MFKYYLTSSKRSFKIKSSFNFSELKNSIFGLFNKVYKTNKETTKINIENLDTTNENIDNLKATKINDEEFLGDVITDDDRSKIIMELKTKSRDLSTIDFSLETFAQKEVQEKIIKGSTMDNLKMKLNINPKDFFIEKQEDYNKLSYMDDILPRLKSLNNLGFSDFHIKVIIHKMHIFLLNSENIGKLGLHKDNLKNILNLTESEVIETIACIPNIIDLTLKKVQENISIINEFLNIPKDNLKNLLLEYPILITNVSPNLKKIHFYFKLYVDMNKEDFHNLVLKFPLMLTITPDNTLSIFREVDRMKLDRKEWRQIIEKDPRVFIFRYTQLINIEKLLSNYGIRKTDIFEFIKQYPDLLMANRYDLLRKKLQLLEELKLNKTTIKNLIKSYPFILLKSYNSFVNKVFYFNTELRMDIEDIDIYPLIYVFNLERDIKPRCELMKKYNTWLPFSQVFSLSMPELAEKLGAKQEEISLQGTPPSNERDLLFKYSKYHTI